MPPVERTGLVPEEKAKGAVLFASLAALCLCLVAFIEIVLRIPLSQRAYAWVGLLGLLCAVVTWKLSPRSARPVAGISLAFLLALLVLCWTPWNMRKIFLQDFRRIDPEMSIGEVSTVMAGYELVYQSTRAMSFRHSTQPRYDSDVGVVYLEEGRVVRTEFSSD